MHIRMHNNDFDIHVLLRSVHFSAKLQKSTKIPPKVVLSVQGKLGVRIFIFISSN